MEVATPQHRWRRGHRVSWDVYGFIGPVQPLPLLRPLTVLSVPEGPGWVEVASYQVWAGWEFAGTEQLLGDSVYVATGFVGRAYHWVGSEGTVIQATLFASSSPDNVVGHFGFDPRQGYQADRSILEREGLPADPTIQARFLGPDVPGTAFGSRAIGFGSPGLTTLAPGGWVRAAPPQGRCWLSLRATAPMSVELRSGDPNVAPVVVWTSAPVDAVTLCVGPGQWIRVTNGGGAPIDVIGTWTDLPQV